ncbi:MAG: 5' nucleotidase, NT5C type [Solirubrobacteraceae bacterium]
MLIAIDVDSTLHDYWKLLSAAAERRFGIDLPYDEQLTWGTTRLRPGQLAACVDDTHSDAEVLAAVPYPGAVEAVCRWRRAGHRIHVMSHRKQSATPATARWLEAIGAPFDELTCCDDKVAGCVEGGVDLLIDDSPLNLQGAIDANIRVATILHPWNRDFCEEEAVIAAADWPALTARLQPLLEGGRAPRRALRSDSTAARRP